jgi:hypothetical protein
MFDCCCKPKCGSVIGMLQAPAGHLMVCVNSVHGVLEHAAPCERFNEACLVNVHVALALSHQHSPCLHADTNAAILPHRRMP